MAIKRSGLVSVHIVAEQLGCSRRHVYNLLHQGELEGVKIGKVRGQRISRESVDRFLDRKKDEEE